jgi:hypothetical protein
MKISSNLFMMAMALALVVLGSFGASAKERVCTDEVLTCRLDQKLLSGGRVFLAEQTEKFSGLNSDEPSIEPEECTLDLWMERDNLALIVKIGDSDYQANIYAQSLSNLGKVLPGSVSFPAVLGKVFYYEYNNLLLSCSLK